MLRTLVCSLNVHSNDAFVRVLTDDIVDVVVPPPAGGSWKQALATSDVSPTSPPRRTAERRRFAV